MTESHITLPVALLSEVVKFEAGPLKEILADIDKSFGISGLTLSVDWEDTYNKLKPSDRSNLVTVVSKYVNELKVSFKSYIIKDNVLRCSMLLSWTEHRISFRVVPGAQFKHAQLAFENGGLVFQLDPKCVFTGSHTAGHVLPENTTTDSAAIMAAVAALKV